MSNTKGRYEIELQDYKNLDKKPEAGYVLFDENKFSHWRGLLDKWIENIKKFCSETNGNVNPYQDNEMCNIGLLETAAWMSGGIAISEHRITFINGKWGRLDLWMKLPNYERIELIEAKHTTRLKLIKKNNELDKYDYNFLKLDLEKRAKEDIEAKERERKVVLLFLTFNSKDKKLFNGVTSKDPTDRINYILKIVTGEEPDERFDKSYIQKDWHLTAWCFPKEMRYVDDYPGIIMSVKSIEN